jgi:DNA polymerase lambda
MAAGSGEVHGTQSSYHGVFRLLEPGSKHRRLDIICVPYNEMGCALLYFTGSDYFNRSMRHFAKQRGYSLSQHGIARRCARRTAR